MPAPRGATILGGVTYRDPRLALRERLRDELSERERALAALGPKVARVRELEARFDREGVPLAFRVPDPPFGPIEAPAEDASLEAWEAALERLAAERAEIEDEHRWLEGRRDALARGVDRAPLGPPPRRVPTRLVVAEALGLSFRVALGAVPAAVVARATGGRAAVWVVGALTALIVALWTARRRRFLRLGRMAEVRLVGTDTSGTQMTNWPVRRARGWAVDSIPFTGAGVRHRLAMRDPEGVGEIPLRLRDVVFEDGVVLVHRGRALATMALHCAPLPTAEGEWARRLAPLARRAVVLGLAAWVVLGALALR